MLRARIGRLRGGSAVVCTFGSSESEMRYHRELITRAIAALRSALLEGIVPGGGSALLRCVNKLKQRYQESADLHGKTAWQILIKAAQAPGRMLLSNAGHEAPGIVIDEIQNGANGVWL